MTTYKYIECWGVEAPDAVNHGHFNFIIFEKNYDHAREIKGAN